MINTNAIQCLDSLTDLVRLGIYYGNIGQPDFLPTGCRTECNYDGEECPECTWDDTDIKQM